MLGKMHYLIFFLSLQHNRIIKIQRKLEQCATQLKNKKKLSIGGEERGRITWIKNLCSIFIVLVFFCLYYCITINLICNKRTKVLLLFCSANFYYHNPFFLLFCLLSLCYPELLLYFCCIVIMKSYENLYANFF